MEEKIPLIFDCDNTFGLPGCDVDDGLALLYLLGCEEVRLLGITCSYGNSSQEKVYANTKRLLKEWGREDIPVFKGAERAGSARSEAAEFLADMAQQHRGTLAVLATGSLSNLLGAAEIFPDFFRAVQSFSLMGGITEPLFVGGRPMKELNLSCDPEASYAVLRQGKRVLLATAQNCLGSYFPKAPCLRLLRSCGKPIGPYLEKALEYWFDIYERQWNLPGFINWDVMAAVQLLHPEFFDMKKREISPTTASLQTGVLLSADQAITVTLPEIADHDGYFRHIYERFFSAEIQLRR